MHEEDFETMLARVTMHGAHRLMIVNAPTGSGKTHAMVWALCRYATTHAEFHAFFVTDQRKNLNEAAFRKAWEASHTQAFEQHVAVVRSLEDTVSLVLKDWADDSFPKALLLPGLPEAIGVLKQQLAYYRWAKQNAVGVSDAWSALNYADYSVRQLLTKRLMALAGVPAPLAASGQAKIQMYVATQHTPACQWVNRVYPTIDLARRQILIMTTAKFISTYTPFFARHSVPFAHSPLLKDAVVVLDEFDSTKAQLWDKAIADALTVRVDLVSLFEAVYQGLRRVGESAPAWLSETFAGKQQFQHLLTRAEQLRERFALDRLYKNPAVSADPGFVIHTPQRSLMSQGKAWRAHLDQDRNQVLLGTEVDDDRHFRQMLG